MKKILTTLAVVLVSLGFAGSALAAKPKPTPAEIRTYTCTVTKGAAPDCARLPGVWNGFAGRVTPVRWDPCSPTGESTLFYFQRCGPMTPTIRQWCTLHFDHRYLGGDLCVG